MVKVNFSTPAIIKSTLSTSLSKKYIVRGSPTMYLKAGILISCTVLGYTGLLFFNSGIILQVFFGLLTGISATGIIFSISHDGVHESFSEKKWINHLAAGTLDILGVSSYFWSRKHRLSHHTYTNIPNQDEDINLGKIARFSEDQPWHWWHRYQHIYLWLLYAFVHIRYAFIDVHTILSGKRHGIKVPAPRGTELYIFVVGRTLFFLLAFVVPMMFHSWYGVLCFYVLISMIIGLISGIVFQLAHSVDIVNHPRESDLDSMPEWTVSQIQTTANFATESRILTWFLGGLNYQREHHLNPQVAHTNYPVMAQVVKRVCEENNIAYYENKTFIGALISHYGFIRKMGERPQYF